MTETARTTPLASRPADSWPRWLQPRMIAALLIIFVAARLMFDSVTQLVPDEAYYWVWSQHLSLSYLDHPPMVAYLIRLGTLVLGDTELGVRWPATLAAVGIVLAMFAATRAITGSRRVAAFVLLMMLCSPMIHVIGSIITPDAPVCLFQTLALYCALLVFLPGGQRKAPPLWCLFGLLLGLALLSKYTAVLLGASTAIGLLISTRGREQLKTPWPYVAAIIAVAVFSPVIVWNAQHQWASFRFQLHHGLGGAPGSTTKNLLNYFGGQLGVATPVLFGIYLFVLAVHARRFQDDPIVRLLLAASVAPLLFFTYSAIHRRPEANWPMFTYLPATLLLALYLAERPNGPRWDWSRLGVVVALVGTILIHCVIPVWKIRPTLATPMWDQLFGWRELARSVRGTAGDASVFTTDYEYASELSYYGEGHPDIRPLPYAPRPTEFDFLGDYHPPQDFQHVVLVRREKPGAPTPKARTLLPGFSQYVIGSVDQFKDRHLIRSSLIVSASQ